MYIEENILIFNKNTWNLISQPRVRHKVYFLKVSSVNIVMKIVNSSLINTVCQTKFLDNWTV